MTNRQFKKALETLGIRQTEFAEAIHVHLRTVANWTGGRSEVPTLVAILINLMLKDNLTVEDLRV
jgi:DNA-binding transcriptional regulator YiaG